MTGREQVVTGHRDEILLHALGPLALGDVADGGDHRHPLSIADQEVRASFHESLAAIRMLDARLVARRRVGVGKDGVVLLHRRGPRLLGKDDGEALADRLLRVEAIERAIGGIDGNDDAIGIGERHCLRGRLPDGPEALFAVAQRGLDGTPLGRDGWLAGVDPIDRGSAIR